MTLEEYYSLDQRSRAFVAVHTLRDMGVDVASMKPRELTADELAKVPASVRAEVAWQFEPRTGFIASIWCALFHKRCVKVLRAEGDWRILRCDRCRVTWAEPRL